MAKVSGQVTVITAEDIAESGASTVVDVLENVPGIRLSRGRTGNGELRGIWDINDVMSLNANVGFAFGNSLTSSASGLSKKQFENDPTQNADVAWVVIPDPPYLELAPVATGASGSAYYDEYRY
ncbi:MAG: TonB-dependent receptor plug domain-containing protein [Spirochaetaceae bacterium]|nr:TonB-dependent receptor plug domain-containing protein [Spirochaetaceae bacterium]